MNDCCKQTLEKVQKVVIYLIDGIDNTGERRIVPKELAELLEKLNELKNDK